MFTITQAFLNAYPGWASAGWAAGDSVDLATFLINLSNPDAKSFIDAHPPKRPGG